jgi:hypothetical protein
MEGPTVKAYYHGQAAGEVMARRAFVVGLDAVAEAVFAASLHDSTDSIRLGVLTLATWDLSAKVENGLKDSGFGVAAEQAGCL